MSIKENLYNQCQLLVNMRLSVIQNAIGKIGESLFSETKSSAGDKHETGRAMLQLEREKAGNQLAEIQKINTILSKIDINNTSKTICLGSVVYTTNANYFIAISKGELVVGNDTFYAISTSTPIGQLLMGKKEGEEIKFREQQFNIITVL